MEHSHTQQYRRGGYKGDLLPAQTMGPVQPQTPANDALANQAGLNPGTWRGLGQEDDQNAFVRRQHEEHIKKLDKEFEAILTRIKGMKERPEDFKQHKLPLARIKKIMKSDEDVKVSNLQKSHFLPLLLFFGFFAVFLPFWGLIGEMIG